MKSLININIESKVELDSIITQYANGGKALSAMYDFENFLRHSYKHGNEEYVEEIRKLVDKDGPAIDEIILSEVANTCLEYFRTKFNEFKQENSVDDWY